MELGPLLYISWEFMTYLSAFLIGGSAISLLLGIRAIKRGRRKAHRNFMLSASLLALLFLMSYTIKSALFPPRTYQGELREIYLFVLVVHTSLAVINIPFALAALYLSLVKKDFSAHRKVARITAPLWISVALTGWIVFFFII